MLLQHLICALILILLAVFTIECTLFPWMSEHRLRVWESNRYEGARARIDGDFAESRRCFSIALQEAKNLKDDKRIAVSMSDLSSVETAELTAKALMASQKVPPMRLVWLSRVDYARKRSKDESFQQWEPYIRALLQRQALISQRNPWRLVELGDAFFEMVQYDLSADNFRKAVSACSPDQSALKVFALDRLAEVQDFQGNYADSRKLLTAALDICSREHFSESVKQSLELHLAQTSIPSGNAVDAERICRALVQTVSIKSDSERNCYAHLLLGQSLAEQEKFDEAFLELTQTAGLAERAFGDVSKESLRTYDTQFYYLLRAKRFDEAKAVFAKITKCRNVLAKKERPQSIMLSAFREGARYIDIDPRTAIWLLEWSLELKQKEQPAGVAVVRRLYGLVKAYRKVGDRKKMLDCWKRARAISPTDPGLQTE